MFIVKPNLIRSDWIWWPSFNLYVIYCLQNRERKSECSRFVNTIRSNEINEGWVQYFTADENKSQLLWSDWILFILIDHLCEILVYTRWNAWIASCMLFVNISECDFPQSLPSKTIDVQQSLVAYKDLVSDSSHTVLLYADLHVFRLCGRNFDDRIISRRSLVKNRRLQQRGCYISHSSLSCRLSDFECCR